MFELVKMCSIQFKTFVDCFTVGVKNVKQVEQMIDYLIEKKMLLEKNNNNELGWAVSEGDIESVKKYIENGADVNAIHLNAPILFAAVDDGNCDVEILITLINAGVNVNAIDQKDGSNALLWLVEGHEMEPMAGAGPFSQERIEAIKLLLNAGADPHVIANDGLSAYNYSDYSKNLIDSLLLNRN